MTRIPLGVSRLDEMFDGGAPDGSTILLATEIGAGGRDFLYTSAVMNGLAKESKDQFDFYYGSLPKRSTLPESIQYYSFTANEEALMREMEFTMEEEIVNQGTDAITFRDLSLEYFRQSQVPTEWYMKETRDIRTLGEDKGKEDVYDAIGEYLGSAPSRSIVAIDSVTDLLSIADDQVGWSDITLLMKGLKKVFNREGGVLLMLANLESLTDEQVGRLMETADGTLMFEWESSGTQRDRTMFVQEFRGVLSKLEDENIIRFETEITESGFDISDVRKIR
ncbi:HTR-like protein [Salinarchaeum sp. IM2453]|uniref:RAD55 family ATPase n=1 Tax=Salinarchaeum sp. IM2453 TaxID=2862870 RepID=UPI001C82EC14|nr:HTR-like protein [Salinarchaeum sp. IM2453]QZA88764.1 HTR-like protein [Salinarchaeum sp. IM2453]